MVVSTARFTFQMTPHKKNRALLGPTNEVAMALHRNQKSPAGETNGEAQHANHCRVGRSTVLLKPEVMVWWQHWG